MGGWDYYCIICGGPFTVRLASRSHERKLPFFNRSRHLWLARFRVLGRNKAYPTAKKCYLSGHAIHETYGGGGPRRGTDPVLQEGEIDYFTVYTDREDKPWCHAIHDSCLALFAMALKLKENEETAPLEGLPAVDKDTLYDMLLESQTIWPGCFGQGIEYYELEHAQSEQFWTTPPDAHPFVLDPLCIPEIEVLIKNLPTIPRARAVVTHAPTNLPAEIISLILSYLGAEDQANVAASTMFPPTFFVPWREKLASEMPFIFEFDSKPFDWTNMYINWAKLYHIFDKDTSLLRRSIDDREYSGMLTQHVQKIDPKIAATARDVFEAYIDPSATEYTVLDDVFEDAFYSDDKRRGWQDCVSDVDREQTGADDSEMNGDSDSEYWEVAELPGLNPEFPGLANRQRIWSTVQPLVDRYLARTINQRTNTSWFENNAIHTQSLCFSYPEVANSILHEDNRVDTVMLLDNMEDLETTSIETQLCFNDARVLTGMSFKLSNGGHSVFRSFGHITNFRSASANFMLAELDNIMLTLRGFDDASRAISITSGIVGISFGLKNGRSILCGNQIGVKRYFVSRENAIITGFSGFRDTQFRQDTMSPRAPVTEQFLNFGVMRYPAQPEEDELNRETENIEDFIWKEAFSEIPDLQFGSELFYGTAGVVPFEVLSFENGPRSARNIIRFGATFCPSTVFEGNQVPVWNAFSNERKSSSPQAIFIEYDDGSRVHVGKIRDSDISHSFDIDGPGGERIARLGNVNKPVMHCRTITTNYGRRFHLGYSQIRAKKWGIKDAEYGREIEKKGEVSMSIKGLVAGWQCFHAYLDDLATINGRRPHTTPVWIPDEDMILTAITTFGENLSEPSED